MEIQENEYIRTKKGKIAKVKTIYSEEDRIKMKNFSVKKETLINGTIKIPDVVKHSKNLIDLIEVGDVIRYKELASDEKYGTIINEIYISDIHSEDELNFIKEEVDRNAIKILSIVTKETFESIKYEV